MTEYCLRFLGAGVALARLVAGVPLEGDPSTLLVSSLRFLGAGLTELAVPFLGAARFFDGGNFGFNEALSEASSAIAGDGALLVSFLMFAASLITKLGQ